jgi:hypothetical protein
MLGSDILKENTIGCTVFEMIRVGGEDEISKILEQSKVDKL